MIARHLCARSPRGAASADVDDLIQAATLGLRDAIATFDPNRGIKFEHYCGPRVRGAALDFLRSLDWAPRLLRSRIGRVQEMSLQLEMQTGAVPTDEQISSALHMPLGNLRSTLRENPAHLRFNSAADARNADGEIDLNSLPEANPLDPAREAQRADLREFLVKGLGRVERLVTTLYYYDNLSFREIAETLNLSESRVSQIHHAVIERLRERMDRIGGNSIDD
jgi:RNA polymerase sigma factor for flagellar operon FliA